MRYISPVTANRKKVYMVCVWYIYMVCIYSCITHVCLKIYRLKTTQTNIETNSLLENVLEVRDYIRNNNDERGIDVCRIGDADNRVVLRKLCHSLNRFFFLFFVEFA